MERATKCDRKANGMVHMKTKQKRHNGSQIKYTNMNECVCVHEKDNGHDEANDVPTMA